MDEETEALLAADFEIGHFFRDRIIPRAVLYFTGEALEDEDDDYEEEEDEDGNYWPGGGRCYSIGIQRRLFTLSTVFVVLEPWEQDKGTAVHLCFG